MAKKKKVATKSNVKKKVKTNKKVAKKTTKKVAKKTTAKKTAKKVVKKTTNKKVAKKAVKKDAPKSAKKVTKKTTAKKVTKKTTAKKVAKKTAKKVTKKSTAKKVAKKVTKKAASKKVVKKTTAKKAASKKVVKKTTAKKVVVKKEKVVAKSEAKKLKKEKVDKKTKTAKSNILEKKNPKEIDVQVNVESLKSKKFLEAEIAEEINEEVVALADEYGLADVFNAIKSIEFFRNDSDECLTRNCENPVTTEGYCRYHYIKNWSGIKKKQEILVSGKLQDLIKELFDKYPPKLAELILADLSDEKSFYEALKEMNIDANEEEFSEDDEGEFDDDIAFETKVTHKPSFDD